MNDRRKDILPIVEDIAEELRLVREHVLVAKQYAENGEVTRFGAHMLSAEGYLAVANHSRQTVAKIHASHSKTTT